jgi:hypothetical protein
VEEDLKEDDPHNILTGLLDDENVIEMANIVLNMDKIVNVANFGQ